MRGNRKLATGKGGTSTQEKLRKAYPEILQIVVGKTSISIPHHEERKFEKDDFSGKIRKVRVPRKLWNKDSCHLGRPPPLPDSIRKRDQLLDG